MYTVIYFVGDGSWRRIGSIKIGEVGLQNGRPGIPMQFEQLKDFFFTRAERRILFIID